MGPSLCSYVQESFILNTFKYEGDTADSLQFSGRVYRRQRGVG